MVGLQIVELSDITDSITLDTPLMEAYKGAFSMNNCMSGDFPLLLPFFQTVEDIAHFTEYFSPTGR